MWHVHDPHLAASTFLDLYLYLLKISRSPVYEVSLGSLTAGFFFVTPGERLRERDGRAMASNFVPGAFPTAASSSTTAVSFATASSVTLDDAAAYPGSGTPQPQQDTQTYLAQKMLSRRAEFIRQQRIRVKVGTWNVAAMQGIETDLAEWIVDRNRDVHAIPVGVSVELEDTGGEIGIYVVGLQEVVDVTARDTYLKYPDPKIEMNWKAHAQAALPDGFTCVASPQLIGVLLLVFVSPRLMPLVGSVSTSVVGTGLMGYVGNKGGVGVRLILGDTLRLVFVDCHLAAFANATDRRNWDAAEITRRVAFEPVGRNFIGLDDEDVERSKQDILQQAVAGEGLDNADVLIWCGDLNYRVELPNEDIRRLLAPHMPKDLPPTHDTPSPIPSSPVMSPASGGPGQPPLQPLSSEIRLGVGLTLEETIENMLQYDQLRKQQRESKAFVGFKEGKISFVPSYKYDVGTVGVWDSSEKARIPSWCDRVLWKVKGADGDRVRGRVRSRTRSSSIMTTGGVIFDTSDSDEEDLVVSRAGTSVSHASSIKILPISSFKSVSGEVKLEQLYYSSYQNVTSSDHKPVASLFELSFPAVVPRLRTMVHAEVAREVDKIENERRPVVTVVVDQVEGQPYEEGVVDFGHVRLGQRIQRSITVANTGTSEAKMSFVGKPLADDGADVLSKEEVIAKDWLKVEFVGDGKGLKHFGGAVVLQPGETCSIIITLFIDKVELVRDLNGGTEKLVDVLVLRVDNGRDVFLPLGGEWVQSGFGRRLSELVRVPEGTGGIRGWTTAGVNTEGGVLYSAPRELYTMTEFLLKNMRELANDNGRWYSEVGWPFVPETWVLDQEKRRKLTVGVWESIDRDLDLENEAALRIALELEEEWIPTIEEIVEVVAGTLIMWLQGLREGVVPVEMWPDVFKAAGERKLGEQVLDKLSATSSSVHANVFVYLTGFLMDTITILSTIPPLPLQRASTGFSLRRAPTDLSLRRAATERDEPPMSPIAAAAAMAFPPRKQSREVLVRKRVLEIFAEGIVRRPAAAEGEKKNGKVEDEEKRRRVAFLEGFVVGI